MFIQQNKQLHPWDSSPIESLRIFINKITDQYGVQLQYHDNIGIFLNDYKIGALLLTYYSHNNSFCNYIKAQPDACNICYCSKEKLCDIVQKASAPFYGKCPMGLEEFIFPVLLGQQVIGYFTVGEFYSNKDLVKQHLEKISAQLKIENKLLYDYFFETAHQITFRISDLAADMNILTNWISLYVQCNSLCTGYTSLKPLDCDSKNYVVDTAKDYILKNYNTPLDLKQIAQTCHCNSSYLSHIFKKNTGMNITEYITSFRINRAKYFLSITDHSISRISEMVGYNDSGYFARVFKKSTGYSPMSLSLESTTKIPIS